MGSVCNLYGRVKDRVTLTLTDKISPLHKDLVRLQEICPSWNRTKANNIFCLTQTKKFEEDFDGQIRVNEDLEPVLAELWRVLGGSTTLGEVTIDLLLEFLAKKFGEGEYSYEEALSKAIDFNKNMLGSSLFVGTIKFNESSGKYKFSVGHNSVENLKQLLQTVEEKHMYDLIVKKLAEKGVGIDLLVSTDSMGEYNSHNPRTLINGLLGMIALQSEGDYGTLTKETGHFIIGSLGQNHALVKRLANLLTSEHGMRMAQRLLPQDYELNKYNSADRVRELMGHLVGQYLLEKATQKAKYDAYPGFRNLVSRIIDASTRFFKTIYTVATFRGDELIAKRAARKLAEEFLGDNFAGTIEEAKAVNEGAGERLKSLSNYLAEMKHVLLQFELYIQKLKTYGLVDEALDLEHILRGMNADFSRILEGTDSDFALKVLAPYIKLLREQKNLLALLASKTTISADYNQEGLAEKDWQRAAATIRALLALTTTVDDLVGVITSPAIKMAIPGQHTDLLGATQNLQSQVKDFMDKKGLLILDNVAVSFLTLVNGCSAFYIPGYRGWFRKKGGELQELSEYLKGTDLGMLFWPERWLYASSSHSHVVIQLIHKAINDQLHKADIASREFMNRIRDLYQEWADLSTKNQWIGKTDKFYERYAGTGGSEYTGNFVSELHWGRWEAEKAEALRGAQDAFCEEKVGALKTYPTRKDALLSPEWRRYKAKFLELWHAEKDAYGNPRSVQKYIMDSAGNPILDSNTGNPKVLYIPNIAVYRNKQWDELSGEAIEWETDDAGNPVYRDKFGLITESIDGELKPVKYSGEKGIMFRLMLMKAELDLLLPPGTIPNYRCPLYTGSLMDAISRAWLGRAGIGNKAAYMALHTVNRGAMTALAVAGAATGAIPATAVGVALRKATLKQMVGSVVGFASGGKLASVALRNILEVSNLETRNEDVLEDKYYEDSEDSSIYDSKLLSDVGLIKSLPLYGVRKLANMDELCTDPFGALIAHAHMCYSYSATLNIVNFAECTRMRLESSGINSTTRTLDNENLDSTKLDVLKDLNDVLNNLVYKYKSYLVGDKWHNKRMRMGLFMAAKFANTWASLTSLFLLGSNKTSALVNLHTAGWEIFKTAWRGDKFSVADWAWAHAALTKHLAQAVWYGITHHWQGMPENRDKWFLWAKRMGVSETDWKHCKPSMRMHYALSLITPLNLLMYPYSTTDFAILSIAYLATLHATKVLDRYGNEKSLWDVYKVRKAVDTSCITRGANKVPLSEALIENIRAHYRVYDDGDDEARFAVWDGFSDEYLYKMDDDDNIYIIGTRSKKTIAHPDGEVEVTYENHYWDNGDSQRTPLDIDIDDVTKPNYKKLVIPLYLDVSKTSHELWIDPECRIVDKNLAAVNAHKNKYISTSGLPQITKAAVDGEHNAITGYVLPDGTVRYFEDVYSKDNSGLSLKIGCRLVRYDEDSGEVIYRYSKLYKSTPKEIERAVYLNLDESGKVAITKELEKLIFQKIQRANSRMHGIYASQELGKLANTLFGPIFLNMRKYFLGLLEAGLARTKYSVYDREVTEGFSITLLKMLIATVLLAIRIPTSVVTRDGLFWSNTGKFLHHLENMAVSALPMSFDGSYALVNKLLREEGFSKYLMANYRNGIILMALISYLGQLLGLFAPDEDDDEEEEEEEREILRDANGKPLLYLDGSPIMVPKEDALSYASLIAAEEEKLEKLQKELKEGTSEYSEKGIYAGYSKSKSKAKKAIKDLKTKIKKMKHTLDRLGAVYAEWLEFKLGGKSARDQKKFSKFNSKNPGVAEFFEKYEPLLKKMTAERGLLFLAHDIDLYRQQLNPKHPSAFGKSSEADNMSDFLAGYISEKNPNWVNKTLNTLSKALEVPDPDPELEPSETDVKTKILQYIWDKASPGKLLQYLSYVLTMGASDGNSIMDNKEDPWYKGNLLGSVEERVYEREASDLLKDEVERQLERNSLRLSKGYIKPQDARLLEFYDLDTGKKFLTAAPKTSLKWSAALKNLETPYSTKGILYYFASRSYWELTSEPNIVSFAMEPTSIIQEGLSLSNIAPSMAIVSTLVNLSEARDAAYGDPFLHASGYPGAHDEEGKMVLEGDVWYKIVQPKRLTKAEKEAGLILDEEPYKIPVVHHAFHEAYYTGQSSYYGQPKYLIQLGKKSPNRGAMTLETPYQSAGSYENARQAPSGFRPVITSYIPNREEPMWWKLTNALTLNLLRERQIRNTGDALFRRTKEGDNIDTESSFLNAFDTLPE